MIAQYALRVLAVALVVCLFPAAGATQEAPDSVITQRIRAGALEAGVPGGVVAIVRRGRPPLVVPFGSRGVDAGPVEASAVFRVGSVSKVLTAATVATLVGDGRLELDADQRETAPWIAHAAGDAPITLRQLLTHTSGLDDFAVGMFAREGDHVAPLGEYLAGRMPSRTTPPGLWTRYSNHGAAVAGWIAADAWGRDFATTVDEALLSPLGMASSSFRQPIPTQMLDRLAPAFPCADADCEPYPVDFRRAPPAGAFVTTADDMVSFMEAVVGDSLEHNGLVGGLLTTRSWAPRPELPGLGLALQEQKLAGHRALVHAGGGSGYSALLALVPQAGAGLFVVTTGGASAFGRGALGMFAGLLPATIRESDPEPEPLSVGVQREYHGSYVLGRASNSTPERFPGVFLFSESVGFDEDGWLLRREGGRDVRYGLVGEDLLEELGGDGRIGFQRNASGAVIGMHAADEYFGVRYPASWIRLPRWEAPHVLNEALSVMVAVPPLLVLFWGLWTAAAAALRRYTKRPSRAPPVSWPVVTAAIALSGAVLMLGFGYLARFNALVMSDPESVAYGVPGSITVWAGLAWPTLGLTLVSAALVVRMFTRRTRWMDRLMASAVTALATGFVVLLFHYHVLP
jgi:CubicO group peptidase (beta-lactamase class C family)